jgi:RNA polymerase sigma factor (sigma-70 family)
VETNSSPLLDAAVSHLREEIREKGRSGKKSENSPVRRPELHLEGEEYRYPGADMQPFKPHDYLDYLHLLARGLVLRRGFANTIDPNDVVQETVLRALRGRPFEGGPVAKYKRWLHTILSNVLSEAIRKALSKPTVDVSEILKALDAASRQMDVFIDSLTSPSQAVSRKEQINLAFQALVAIPGEWGTAVYLKHCESLPLAQIAHEMKRTVGEVTEYLCRGMEALRQRLGGE